MVWHWTRDKHRRPYEGPLRSFLVPQNQETDPTDSLAFFSQAQSPWEPKELTKKIMGVTYVSSL